jgi:hypothetical protein
VPEEAEATALHRPRHMKFFTFPDEASMLFWFLAAPVAIIVRACTTEEVAREARDYCIRRHGYYQEKQCQADASLGSRVCCFALQKLHYMPTCDYCLSFWVSLVVVVVAQYEMAFDDWRGTALACFVVMGVANVYLSLFSLLRVDSRKERAIAKTIEQEAVEDS